MIKIKCTGNETQDVLNTEAGEIVEGLSDKELTNFIYELGYISKWDIFDL